MAIIYVPIVMYGLREFIVVLHDLHCLLQLLFSEKYVYTKLRLDWLLRVSYVSIYVPIIMYYLRMFIVELDCLQASSIGCFTCNS